MTEKHIHTLSALSLSSSFSSLSSYHHHQIIARRSLERQSLVAFVNRWCCCNVLCDCAGQCTSGSPYCTRRRWRWRRPGRVELFLRRARFSSSFWWRFTSAFVITSFFDRLQQARWHVASSKLFGWISHALRSRLLASLNRRTRRLTFLTPVFNWSYRNSLGMRPSSIRWTCPSHLGRRWLRMECMLGVLVRDSISLLVTWSCHLKPRMRLRNGRWKVFKRFFCPM